jgi:3'(2'), 5'-bisphosphate nucleotidase
MNIDINSICEIALRAGRAILEIYESKFTVELKDDKSPLTAADKASHEIICENLRALYPDIPVFSEEGKKIPYEKRKDWKHFWLVDPLDGTKEFVKRNGEFTVNIALIEQNKPVLGVIYVPVQNILYYAVEGKGAWKQNGGKATKTIHVKKIPEAEGLIVVKSRSHPSEKLQAFLDKLHIKEELPRGSSLKLCAVAEGSADIYPRLGPIWEWDTAAGHAIINEAGGHVVNQAGVSLRYNKEIIKHDHFIAVSDLSLLP